MSVKLISYTQLHENSSENNLKDYVTSHESGKYYAIEVFHFRNSVKGMQILQSLFSLSPAKPVYKMKKTDKIVSM